MAKIRFDWTLIGLAKDDKGIVTFDGIDMSMMPDNAKEFALHYGIYALATRETARSANLTAYTTEEKKELVRAKLQWLIDGMPKQTRANAVKVDAFMVACDTVMKSKASKAEKTSAIKSLELGLNRKYIAPVEVK